MFQMGSLVFFFFKDTATTEISTLSLPDALPSYSARRGARRPAARPGLQGRRIHGAYRRVAQQNRRVRQHQHRHPEGRDRKSTRLNSSHANISYAVFCLKKKNRPTSTSSFYWSAR